MLMVNSFTGAPAMAQQNGRLRSITQSKSYLEPVNSPKPCRWHSRCWRSAGKRSIPTIPMSRNRSRHERTLLDSAAPICGPEVTHDLTRVLSTTRDRSSVHPLGRSLGCDNEVAEICCLLRRAFRPEGEQLASILSGMRAVSVAGLEMQRSASLVLLALVGEVAFNHIKRLSHALVEMCRNHRSWLHSDV